MSLIHSHVGSATGGGKRKKLGKKRGSASCLGAARTHGMKAAGSSCRPAILEGKTVFPRGQDRFGKEENSKGGGILAALPFF